MDAHSGLPSSDPRRLGEAFLDALASGEKLDQRVVLVVAHPGNEAIGAGGQLHKIPNLTIVIASDGIPRSKQNPARFGIRRTADNIEIRRSEFAEALAVAGLVDHSTIALGLPHGEVIHALDHLVPILTETFRNTEAQVVLTHAYEGGHVDHDAVALAVNLACRRAAREKTLVPAVIEMPFYHAGPYGWIVQSFATRETKSASLYVAGDAWRRKCAMLDAHRSQRDALHAFRQPVERFRIAPDYDFRQLPNHGQVLYAEVTPELSPQTWLQLARAALETDEAKQ